METREKSNWDTYDFQDWVVRHVHLILGGKQLDLFLKNNWNVTSHYNKNKISIKNLIQNPYKKNNKASVTIITHRSLENNYNNLLNDLRKNKFVLKKPTYIRIERFQ